ncbi:MAG: hypothetical protein U0587_10585 [Candidatus Binatia bacterium]
MNTCTAVVASKRTVEFCPSGVRTVPTIPLSTVVLHTQAVAFL